MNGVSTLNYEQLGINIRKYRKKMGLSQFELAEKSDVSPSYIGYIERAKKTPSLKTILKIADSLNISVSVLLGENIEELQNATISQINSHLKDMNIEDLNFILENLIYFKSRISPSIP